MILPFGYNSNKIFRFTKIQAAAAEAQTTQQFEYCEKNGTYDKFGIKFKPAKIELSSIVKVAKVALKNNSVLSDKLNLYGKKYGKTNDIFACMDSFWDKMLYEKATTNNQFPYNNTARSFQFNKSYYKTKNGTFLQPESAVF